MCENCKKLKWQEKAMNAGKCGHPTVRVGMKWCQNCAKKKESCEACGLPLNRLKPGERK